MPLLVDHNGKPMASDHKLEEASAKAKSALEGLEAWIQTQDPPWENHDRMNASMGLLVGVALSMPWGQEINVINAFIQNLQMNLTKALDMKKLNMDVQAGLRKSGMGGPPA